MSPDIHQIQLRPRRKASGCLSSADTQIPVTSPQFHHFFSLEHYRASQLPDAGFPYSHVVLLPKVPKQKVPSKGSVGLRHTIYPQEVPPGQDDPLKGDSTTSLDLFLPLK